MASQPSGGCPQGESDILHHATLTDAHIRDHPCAFYKAMRDRDPVFYDEQLGMYLVSRYEDAQTVLRDSTNYSAERGYNDRFAKGYFEEFKAILERDGGGYFPDVIKSDPPTHTRLRQLLGMAFTAHRVNQLEPQIAKIAVNLVEAMAAKEAADGVRDFSVPMTLGVICQQLGIGQFDTDKIRRWAHALLQQIGLVQTREQMLEHAKQICECQNFVIAQIKDRQENPKEDMISDLVHARAEGEVNPTLNFAETVSLVRALMIAGHETTQTGMSSLLFVLSTQPRIVEKLYESVNDDRFLTRFVAELLRMEPPIKVTSRMTTRDVELAGKKLPEGAHLLIVYGSANSDERMFSCPEAFDVDRPNLGSHIAFGAGVHRCVGAPLASLEIKIAAREIVKRLDNIKLTIPVEDIPYVPSIASHGIASLPIAFTRRH